jgi:tetratricopeptide (TPR) repeat protein
MIVSFKISRLQSLAIVLVLFGVVTGTTNKMVVSSRRPTIAVLWFEDRTNDPQEAHWRYAITGLLTGQLKEVRAIRVLPSIAVDYAFRQLGIHKGAAIEINQAHKMGELIEAQRVVWGRYWRENEQWHVRVCVLNVASGKASEEFSTSSADWLEVGHRLTEHILKELNIKPSEECLQKMNRRLTDSTVAFEWYSKAYALQAEGKEISQQEENARKAIEADPEFARAHISVSGTLLSQGKFTESEQAVRQALKIRPDYADAHVILGILLALQEKPVEAEAEFQKAHRLDPDYPESLIRLGELYTIRQKWDEAITFIEGAKLLNPTNAAIHSSLGYIYALKRERAKAMVELKETQRLDPEGLERINAEQMICQAYEVLGEIPLAVEHYEKFVILARKQGVNPKMVGHFEERGRQLKTTLTPTFIEASMPKIYSEQELQAELKERLTKDELEMVVNPIANSPGLRCWAQQLTTDSSSDLEKAKALFDALTRRIEIEGGRGKRTAQEVFAAWSSPEESFSCQEYAKLFVTLARNLNIKAFYVHVEKDYREKAISHDCAVVFVDGRALLVDPAYRWFGVPHKEFVILDDLQTIAHHLFQSAHISEDVSRCQIAVKLHPNFAWGQLALVGALVRAKKWDEARKVLDVAMELEPDRWDIYLWLGIFVKYYGQYGSAETADNYFRKALQLNPQSARAHYCLALGLLDQSRLKEAREEFRATLRYDPEPEMTEDAYHQIARINELIGTETNSLEINRVEETN